MRWEEHKGLANMEKTSIMFACFFVVVRHKAFARSKTQMCMLDTCLHSERKNRAMIAIRSCDVKH